MTDPFAGIFDESQAPQQQAPQGSPSYQANTPHEAAYLLKQIRDLKLRIEEAEGIMKAEIQRIRNWFQGYSDKCEAQLSPMKEALKAYIQHRRERDPKYVLRKPHGSAFITAGRPKWIWSDEEEICKFLESSGYEELVKVDKKLDKKEIMAKFTVSEGVAVDIESGMVLDGVVISDGENSLSLRLNADDDIDIVDAA